MSPSVSCKEIKCLCYIYHYHTWYFHSLMTSTFWCQNILRHFTWSAPPLFYSWPDSPIGCSAPLYSRSGSLIRSAYYFLYISFCFRFNKSHTNLTSLRLHHLQYTIKTFLMYDCTFLGELVQNIQKLKFSECLHAWICLLMFNIYGGLNSQYSIMQHNETH
jgi:hypothetical protein